MGTSSQRTAAQITEIQIFERNGGIHSIREIRRTVLGETSGQRAFGIALAAHDDVLQLAAVDDVASTVEIWHA